MGASRATRQAAAALVGDLPPPTHTHRPSPSTRASHRWRGPQSSPTRRRQRASRPQTSGGSECDHTWVERTAPSPCPSRPSPRAAAASRPAHQTACLAFGPHPRAAERVVRERQRGRRPSGGPPACASDPHPVHRTCSRATLPCTLNASSSRPAASHTDTCGVVRRATGVKTRVGLRCVCV